MSSANLYPSRKRLFHATPEWVRSGCSFFITICCDRRHTNQLCNHSVKDTIWQSVEYYQKQCRWYCKLLFLMPDHLHGIISFPEQIKMTNQIKAFKSYVAKNCGVRWQDGFFDHRMRKSVNLFTQYDYFSNNPVRAGLCEKTSDWGYIWTPEKIIGRADRPDPQL